MGRHSSKEHSKASSSCNRGWRSALTNALVVRVSASELERINTRSRRRVRRRCRPIGKGKALLERADVRGNVDAAVSAFEQAASARPKFGLGSHRTGGGVPPKIPGHPRPDLGAASDRGSHQRAYASIPIEPKSGTSSALTLAGAGQLDEASAELYRALALQPNYEDARRQLGQVLAEQGNIDGAIIEFRRAIALRPDVTGRPIARWVSRWCDASRYEEAVKVLSERGDALSRQLPDLSTAGHRVSVRSATRRGRRELSQGDCDPPIRTGVFEHRRDAA